MTLKLNFPHIVKELRKKEITSDLSDDLHTKLLDIENVRKHLQEEANVYPSEMEREYEDPDSKQTKKLKALINTIQKATGSHQKGLWIITNSPTKIYKYLSGVAYVWAMTLNKSVLVDETFNVLKALYKGISSFNPHDDEAGDKYRHTSLLCLNSLTPVVSVNAANVTTLALLLTTRVTKFNDTFTILVSVINTDDENFYDPDKLNTMIRLSKKHIKDVYGDSVSSLLEHNFETMAFPFKAQSLSDIAVIPD